MTEEEAALQANAREEKRSLRRRALVHRIVTKAFRDVEIPPDNIFTEEEMKGPFAWDWDAENKDFTPIHDENHYMVRQFHICRKRTYRRIQGKRWDQISFSDMWDLNEAILSKNSMRYYIQAKLLIPQKSHDIINLIYEQSSVCDASYLTEFLPLCSDEQQAAIYIYVKAIAREGNVGAREDIVRFWVDHRWRNFGRTTLVFWDIESPEGGRETLPHRLPEPKPN